MLSTKKCFRCDLSYANLINANLSGAIVDTCAYPDAYFSYANLKNARITGGGGMRANFSYADMTNAVISFAIGDANLSHATVFLSNMQWVHLEGANLTGLSLTGVSLVYAILTNANLTDVNFDGQT